MPRKPRIHFPGAVYHVIVRGNAKNEIFFSHEDREKFFTLLNEGTKLYDHRIHAFCLMSNHVHLVIEVGNISLEKIVHNFSFRYAQSINKKRERVGHLFQGRYKAILVDSDQYFLQLIRYVHLNPIRANLVTCLNEYPWSSHRAYLGKVSYQWLTTEDALSYFSNNYTQAISEYLKFINEEIDDSEQSSFVTGNQGEFDVLGNEDFLQKIGLEKNDTGQPIISLETLTEIICNHYSISVTELRSRSKVQLHSKVRVIIAMLVKELRITTLSKLAAYLNRDPKRIKRAVQKLGGLKEIVDAIGIQRERLLKFE